MTETAYYTGSTVLLVLFMAIADVFDALVSKRCYKDPIPVDQAFDIIKEESGIHLDPKPVEVFLKHKEKYANINIIIHSTNSDQTTL